MNTGITYRKLKEPGFIGSVRIKNRIIRAGSNQGFPPEYDDGHLQSYYSDFYEAMARGGVGLVTIGASPVGAPPGRGYRIDDDRFIPGLRAFTDRMHRHDCPVFLQTFHIGPWMPGELSAAASTLSEAQMPITTQSIPNAHSLSIPEIQSIVAEIGRRAERARKAGFDGIEVNAGCTHLFSTFMSRLWNRSADRYGFATVENRSRIVVEVIREIRARAGTEFAIVVLFNPVEPGIADGITAAEGIAFAKIFAAAGVDAIIPRVEYYIHHRFDGKNDSSHFPDVILYPQPPEHVADSGMDYSRSGVDGWLPLQAAIKKAVTIPVVAVGRIDPDTAEERLEKGEIDFVSMTRNLIADPEYPNKLFAGRSARIAPCTACMTCFDLGEQALPVTCRINAAAFKEASYALRPAAQRKKVVVIGAGAAGMEAARVAARRGHQVILLEKEAIVGGAMNPYAVIMSGGKEDVSRITAYLIGQLEDLKVDTRLNTTADRTMIERMAPDVVIVAVGGRHTLPAVPGVQKKQVLTSRRFHDGLRRFLEAGGSRLTNAMDSTYGPVGSTVVIIGGDYHGTQTAEFLIKRGCRVSIVEAGPQIGARLLHHLVRPQIYEWLYRHQVPMFINATLRGIEDNGVQVATADGREHFLAADTILVALPFAPDDELFKQLQGAAAEMYCIGDCRRPGKIVDAVADGARIGREI